jgi:putative Ca2+/H+ antiporter (TMEM165/GDT1 family)
MDWRLIGSTFLIIFLAELGDKTQLTALASAAGSRSTWMVFLGASAALVCSTLLAVAVGHWLQGVMNPKWLRVLAGCAFLVVGAIWVSGGLKQMNFPGGLL